MSSKHKKFRPYVRRLKPGDKSDDFRTAVQLALFRAVGWSGWVIAQHGFPGVVTAVERTKGEIMRKPFQVMLGQKTFKEWARDFQRYASGHAEGGKV